MANQSTNKVYKPEELQSKPFPGKASAATIPSTLRSQEIFYPQEFVDEPFPTQIVARNVISQSLNTQSNRITGSYGFSSLGAIQIGAGSPSIKISPLGIVGINSSGVTTFTLDGTTGGLSLLGALVAGAGSVIDGVYITDATISTAKIADLAVTNAKIANLAVNAAKIALATITSAQIHDLNADAITAGTISVGGTGQANAIVIKKDNSHGDSNLRWEGASKVWEDSSNQLGLRSAGTSMYFYTGNYLQRMIINSSGQNVMYGGLSIQADAGGNNNLNVAGDCKIDGHLEVVSATTKLPQGTQINGHALNMDRGITINSSMKGAFTAYNDGSGHLRILDAGEGGTEKTAIVNVDDKYLALYCIESPEVWFVDFCNTKDTIDPMFLEVTTGEMKFIKCDDGTYQVWRRRKGYSEKRFEHKTFEEFKKNNEFWAGAKLN